MMIWLLPILLIAFGTWRFLALRPYGLVETCIGLIIMSLCCALAVFYLIGAWSCAAFC